MKREKVDVEEVRGSAQRIIIRLDQGGRGKTRGSRFLAFPDVVAIICQCFSRPITKGGRHAASRIGNAIETS